MTLKKRKVGNGQRHDVSRAYGGDVVHRLELMLVAEAIYLFVEGVLEFTLWFQLSHDTGKSVAAVGRYRHPHPCRNDLAHVALERGVGDRYPRGDRHVLGGISRLVLSLVVRRRTE
jgi:hypothetical protein